MLRSTKLIDEDWLLPRDAVDYVSSDACYCLHDCRCLVMVSMLVCSCKSKLHRSALDAALGCPATSSSGSAAAATAALQPSGDSQGATSVGNARSAVRS